MQAPSLNTLTLEIWLDFVSFLLKDLYCESEHYPSDHCLFLHSEDELDPTLCKARNQSTTPPSPIDACARAKTEKTEPQPPAASECPRDKTTFATSTRFSTSKANFITENFLLRSMYRTNFDVSREENNK